jgi:hypothetical protein
VTSAREGGGPRYGAAAQIAASASSDGSGQAENAATAPASHYTRPRADHREVMSSRRNERTNETKQTNETIDVPPAPPAADPTMYHGVLGELVEAADPTTEADPVGVYVSLQASAGAAIGNGAYVQIGNARHPLLIWPLLFGRTGSGRKGEATTTADVFIRRAVADAQGLFVTGLSSGEGVVERIRDPRNQDDSGGTEDKRLRVLEPEFGSVMARAKRDGSTLGDTLREAWSGSPLGLINRSAIAASWSHVAIIGHITPKEFRLKLAETQLAGGTFNRFLPIYVEQSKRLPIPEGLDAGTLEHLSGRLRDSIELARGQGSVRLDVAATKLWCDELYDEFSGADDDDGAWAEFTRRAAPYCRRIAALNAVLDGRNVVNELDMLAAAAQVRYAIGSAKYVLDWAVRNPKTERLRRAVDGAGASGMGRREISALFSRNLNKAVLDALLDELVTSGGYEAFVDAGSRGRPAQKYRRVPKSAARTA